MIAKQLHNAKKKRLEQISRRWCRSISRMRRQTLQMRKQISFNWLEKDLRSRHRRDWNQIFKVNLRTQILLKNQGKMTQFITKKKMEIIIRMKMMNCRVIAVCEVRSHQINWWIQLMRVNFWDSKKRFKSCKRSFLSKNLR